ncbi:LysE family translocator [Pantoea agglomerans]|jgi:threonine/homoserine/homoserine lactone efflux protein|uniref:LysE family translocator n=1 Tax=Pantoea TaxID=53335 RepID=UPI0007E54CB0|nr:MULTISPECIES: LysE family translocator [Pantoea]KAF6675815.1 LysE family translocator [Pantoea sp. EKM20T]MBA8871175.1 threonine/homoserine/homoserine lactone efflux protein [Pantoea agglomerans]MBA8875783.1 threonine/homoserine/homoserine lactone efflux protein [Pantoea agglomerans]MBD8130875.1 LysE family translocator [Pantoea agglomerans]MCL6412395.1 LysE family translocator [Pantoea agglomerans]
MLDPSFFSYVTVMSITPGPNNLLLATSGVNFGMRRTLPMVFGILVGCALQTVIAGVALEVLLHWMAAIRLPLTLAGCAYLLWLSWKIFRAAAPEVRSKPQPMTLLGGACFQAINPKAWLMATNVALLYSASSGVLTVMIGFMLLNLPCILIWAALGDRLRSHLQVAWKRQLFNSLMALSLVATTIWMLTDALLAA